MLSVRANILNAKNVSLLHNVNSQSISFSDNCTPGFLLAKLRRPHAHKFHFLVGGGHGHVYVTFSVLL